jgi:arylsulfatase A-like enzyme
LNVILILSDTFRADHLGAYGLPAPWSRKAHENEPFIATPNLDAFAKQSALFERFYAGSYPTIPCRLDLFTGRYSFLERGWEPLRSDDVILPEILGADGYVSELIFDTPALADDGFNFTRGFTGWDWIRGQHCDRWLTDPVKITLPSKIHKISGADALRPYLLNSTARKYERDWSCAKTMSAAAEWLERNHTHEKFFLYVDTWDPHEPFDAPRWYRDRYSDPNYHGDPVIYPRYGRSNYLDEDEVNDIRSRYAAKVSLVDNWIGEFLRKIESLHLLSNTLIIFMSDHGHLFAEHNLQGKPTGPLGMLYESSIRIPLLIRHPGGFAAGARIEALAQPCDLFPTIMEATGIPIPPTVSGRSLWPIIAGEKQKVRDLAVSGRYSSTMPGSVQQLTAGKTPAQSFDGWMGVDFASEPITVTSVDYALICPPTSEGVPELYAIGKDPLQRKNLIVENQDVALKMHAALTGFLKENNVPQVRAKAYDWPVGKLPDKNKVKRLDENFMLSVVKDGKPWFGFVTEKEAQNNFPDANVIDHMSKKQLEREDPHSLICLGRQYYWPNDGLDPSFLE